MTTQPEWMVSVTHKDAALEWGPKLWPVLNQACIVKLMLEATDHNRPAAEAITSQLLGVFGNGEINHRVKQYAGILVSLVMQKHGYRHHRRNVPCSDKRIFRFASTYTLQMV